MAADFLSEIGRPGPEFEQQRKGRMTQNKKKLRLTKMKKKKWFRILMELRRQMSHIGAAGQESQEQRE